MLFREITSTQNETLKETALLATKTRGRRESGKFLVEGLREVRQALANGWECESLWIEKGVFLPDEIAPLFPDNQTPANLVVYEVPGRVMEKLAYRTGIPNAVAVMHTKPLELPDKMDDPTPLVLILEQVEKPGNLGAMLRTADAAGVHLVIVCDPGTDVWNPNCVRASLGAFFTVPIALAEPEAAISWCRTQGLQIMATWLEGSTSLYEADFSKGVAVVMGAEATGISRDWVAAADQRLLIPMFGKVDSLNVSVSAAIVLYEALRQRIKRDSRR